MDKKDGLLIYLGYILAAILCIYNHHFSMLQAGIIGVTGLFVIDKTLFKKYILANFIVVLLFLPNLIVMKSQMQFSGRTFIPEANLDHVLDYLFYIFQYSFISITIVLGILSYSLIQTKKLQVNKYQIISLVWFVLPLVIGVIVSNVLQPVMPKRVLIFSFPFLIVFLFSFTQYLKKMGVLIASLLILTVNIYGLVIERGHYQIFQKNIGKSSVENIKFLIKEKQVKDPYTIYDYAKVRIDYYWGKQLPDLFFESLFEYRDKKKYKASEFREKIAALENDALILCNVPKKLICIAREYYPYLIFTDKGFCYDFYCFSKNETASLEKLCFHFHNRF